MRERQGQRGEDGYYDELDIDIDEGFLEGLVIISLAATLLVLVYLRQQRNNRQREGNGGGGDAGGGGGNDGDRGFFPRPGEPEFAQWVAGGIGH